MKQAELAIVDATLRKYADAGLMLKEAALNLGLSYHCVHARARKNNIIFRRGTWASRTPDARAIAMRDAYLAGSTLECIGREYGVTRERVRQILTKYFGRLRDDGGAALIARRKREQHLAAVNKMAMERWGCSRQQYGVLQRMTKRLIGSGVNRDRTPIGAFATHRSNSRRRGIPFELTLWEWWTIWQQSGKWSRRGRRRGQFVMCRKGDVGPYAKDNVFIALACENISDATKKNNLPVGVTRGARGRYEARSARNGVVTVWGVYDTPEEAHFAYLKSLHKEAA